MVHIKDAEHAIEFFLGSAGASVRKIPENNAHKTPDFEVEIDGQVFLVEAKTLEAGKPPSHEPYTEVSNAHFLPKVLSKLNKSYKQCQAYDTNKSLPWLAWLHDNRLGNRTLLETQVTGVVYGMRQIVYAADGDGKAVSKHCLYADKSLFSHHPETAAVVISGFYAPVMFVNEFSLHTNFEQSALAGLFLERGLCAIPERMVDERGYLSMREVVHENLNPNEKSDFLQAKYGLQSPIILDPNIITSTVVIPDVA